MIVGTCMLQYSRPKRPDRSSAGVREAHQRRNVQTSPVRYLSSKFYIFGYQRSTKWQNHGVTSDKVQNWKPPTALNSSSSTVGDIDIGALQERHLETTLRSWTVCSAVSRRDAPRRAGGLADDMLAAGSTSSRTFRPRVFSGILE